MIEVLSQLVRKPSKVSSDDLVVTGWKEKQTRVIKHMENDPQLIRLLEDFKVANDRLKYIRSTKDIRIYFAIYEKGGEDYLYARCLFNVDGKPREFRKYLGIASEVNTNKLDMDELKQIFLRMLKNNLEN